MEVDELKKILADVVPDGEGPGVAVGVGWSDGAVMACRGMANIEHRVPITPDTSFHLASVSKQFTAFVVAELVARGILAFGDDLGQYVPEIEAPGATIDHLIHHTSGLRDQWALVEAAGLSMADDLTEARILQLLAGQRRLMHEPGARFRYTNTGYTLLARVAERAAQLPFRQLVQEIILDPCGMGRTTVADDVGLVIRGRAQSYDSLTGRAMPLSYSLDGATSLNSTIGDLLTWSRFTIQPAQRSRREMPGRLRDGSEVGYGLGVRLAQTAEGRRVWHLGADAGFRSQLTALPDEAISIAVLSNDARMNTDEITMRVLERLRDEGGHVARRPVNGNARDARSDRPDSEVGRGRDGCHGDFRGVDEPTVIRFEWRGDTLGLREASEWTPLRNIDGTFSSDDSRAFEARFARDGSRVTVWHGHGASPFTALRLKSEHQTDDDNARGGTYFSAELGSVAHIHRDPRGLQLVTALGVPVPLVPIAAGIYALAEAPEAGGPVLTFHSADEFTFDAFLAHGVQFRRLNPGPVVAPER